MEMRRSDFFCFGVTGLFLLLTVASPVDAQNAWVNPGSGLWRDGSNWSAGAPPGSTTTLTLITNANTKTVTIDTATLSANRSVRKLTVSAPPGSTNTLALVDLGATNPFQLLNTFTIDNGGGLYLTNSGVVVNGTSGGSFNILGGTAILDSGMLDVSTVTSRVGRVTSGILQIKMGTVQAGEIIVGEFTGSHGTLSLEGGKVILSSLLSLGDGASCTGIVSVTGGDLSVTNDITKIGNLGTGRMVVSNAAVALGSVSVARHDGASGTIELQTNGALLLSDDLSIGRFSGSTGLVLVAGGRLSIPTNTIWVGREGGGQLTVSNGAVQALALLVAGYATNTASGTASMTGGMVTVSSNLTVGNASFRAGQMSISGGHVNVTNDSNTALLSIPKGTLSLGGGTITVDSLVLTHSTGALGFSAGTLETKGTAVANGAPFVVGDGTSAATLHLLGGTHSFADGLVISKNATLSGCGTIVGNVINNGTIATNCGAAPAAPSITTQPASLVVTQGQTAIFSVTATGDPPLDYQWRRNEQDIAGATDSVLTILNAQTFNEGTYTVRVRNGAGTTLSDPATLTVLVPPVITTQPLGQAVTKGATVVFSVAATGTPPLRYEWFFNGTNTVGAASATLGLTNVQPADAGSYTVKVSNDAGNVTSDPAVLRVLFAPLIGNVGIAGTDLSFTFLTGNGFTYTVEYKNTLTDTAWSTLKVWTGTGGALTASDTPTSAPTRFYRVRVN